MPFLHLTRGQLFNARATRAQCGSHLLEVRGTLDSSDGGGVMQDVTMVGVGHWSRIAEENSIQGVSLPCMRSSFPGLASSVLFDIMLTSDNIV